MKIKFLSLLLLLTFTFGYSQNYSAIDQHAIAVKYTKDYKKATQDLIAPYTDETSKARAIFTWIAENISYDTKMRDRFKKEGKKGYTKYQYRNEAEKKQKEKEHQDGLVKKVLKRKKGVCQDYALLYRSMCEEAGLECQFVTGFGRFSPNNIGKEHKGSNHAWNAVKIDGKWELMDVTWSTGMGADEDYGNGFFMVKPEAFIMSHRPDDDQWQLLEKPLSIKEFADQAFPYFGFIKYNARSFEPSSGKVLSKGKVTIDLDIEPGQQLYLIRKKTPLKLKAVQEGTKYTFDLSQKSLRGNIIIGVSSGRSIQPVVGFKVKA